MIVHHPRSATLYQRSTTLPVHNALTAAVYLSRWRVESSLIIYVADCFHRLSELDVAEEDDAEHRRQGTGTPDQTDSHNHTRIRRQQLATPQQGNVLAALLADLPLLTSVQPMRHTTARGPDL